MPCGKETITCKEDSEMKKIAKTIAGHLAELVFVAGAAAFSVGVGLIHFPAGLIAGGALAMIGAGIAMMGGDGR